MAGFFACSLVASLSGGAIFVFFAFAGAGAFAFALWLCVLAFGFAGVCVGFAVVAADRSVEEGAHTGAAFVDEADLAFVALCIVVTGAGAWAFSFASDLGLLATCEAFVAIGFAVSAADGYLEEGASAGAALAEAIAVACVAAGAVLVGLAGDFAGACAFASDASAFAFGFTGVAVGLAIFAADGVLDGGALAGLAGAKALVADVCFGAVLVGLACDLAGACAFASGLDAFAAGDAFVAVLFAIEATDGVA